MCSTLSVSRSGYYAWLNRKESKRSVENKMIVGHIKRIYHRSSKTYGSPRITAELQQLKIPASRPRVARLMRKNNIRSKVRRKFKVTTDSKHTFPIKKNSLMRNFSTDLPAKVWVSDITYIKVNGTWLYLTVVIDLFDRKVVGWSFSDLSFG